MANNVQLDAEQRAFADSSAISGALAVMGAAGSGKTRALTAHLQRSLSGIAPQANAVALTTADPSIINARICAEFSPSAAERCVVATISEFAGLQLTAYARACGFTRIPVILNDRAAKLRLLDTAGPLFDLEWTELQNGALDPEVSGIRYPQRFCSALFDFFERLRAANIDPVTIVETAQRGSTTFYGAPPNFADAELVRSTKETYRDSLRVSAAELGRQREREHALALIAERLARGEEDDARTTGRFSRQAALRFLTARIVADASLRNALLDEFPIGIIDEAQDLSEADRSFLRALYGIEFAGLAFAGDPEQSMRAARGANDKLIFGVTENVVQLHGRYRGNKTLWNLQTVIASENAVPAIAHDSHSPEDAPPAIVFARTGDRAVEARAIAVRISEAIAAGIAPERCAVVVRNLACADAYSEALLAQNIHVDFMGRYEPLADKGAEDVHALFRALADRADAAAFLRLAASDMLRCSDRTLALLCGAESDPTLFAIDQPVRESAARHPERIAENMLDGTVDHTLSSEIRERLHTFRERMAQFAELAADPIPAHLARIAADSGLLSGNSARTQLARRMTARLITALVAQRDKLEEDAPYSLAVLLREYGRECALEAAPDFWPRGNVNAVCIADADALRGYEFDVVLIADARAGAFPRYYVPDAFLFSPARGFVPRENAGAASPNRTAKFTWYIHAAKAREGYMREERRLFASIIGRVRTQLSVSASGAATRGITAPEFLEELRRRKLPGSLDISKNI